MNNITQYTKCVNCAACMNVCPEDAISVDKCDYFYKYKVDESKCIQCGACTNVCPVNNPKPFLNLKNAYGGWHNDKSVVRTSSSGGAFTAIADYILSREGVVYGAAYSEDYKSVLIRSTDDTNLDNIKRSKYVESYVGLAFRNIKSDLMKERMVLFCGTPCQVAGLKRYLQKEYSNLVTVDFACGGLTSHKIFEEYMNDLEKKYRGQISSVNFRAGLYGWKNYSLKVDFDNGRSYKTPSEIDPYVYSFMYSRCANRDNCLDCKFRNNHYSDFVVADFWKWFEYSNLKNDETGISLILTNSDKAEAMMPEIEKVMHLEQLDINQAMYNCFVKPPVTKAFLAKKSKFFSDYEKTGLRTAAINSGMLHGIKGFILKIRLRSNMKGIDK